MNLPCAMNNEASKIVAPFRNGGERMSNKTKIIQGILIVGMLAWLVGIHIYINEYNDKVFTYGMEEESEAYELRFEIPKHWSEISRGYINGMQYDVTFKNNTDEKLYNWSMEIKVPEGCYIDSYWNGSLTYEGDTIHFEPLQDIQIVDPQSNRTFGFILFSQTLMDNIQGGEVSFHKRMVMSEAPIFHFWLIACGLVFVFELILLVSWIRTYQLQKKKEEFEDIIEQSFHMFANVIDAKDPYTRGHSQRVAYYSRKLAKRMGLSEDERQKLSYIALLHDIGKIGVTDAILNKKGALTAEERASIEKHVTIGGDILKDFTAIEGIEEGARYHHERYDGKGYASGLKGEEIPLFARIIAVADSFDAMSSERCYRPALEISKIVSELKNGAGSQFDPQIVKHMLDMIEEGKAPIQM